MQFWMKWLIHVEKLLLSLDLPYRILRLCGGDMSFASAITYDFEVFTAAQEKWLEVSSVSNFESFQTNRMKIRFKDDMVKRNYCIPLTEVPLHCPEFWPAFWKIIRSTDYISLPKVLHSYFGAQRLLKPFKA